VFPLCLQIHILREMFSWNERDGNRSKRRYRTTLCVSISYFLLHLSNRYMYLNVKLASDGGSWISDLANINNICLFNVTLGNKLKTIIQWLGSTVQLARTGRIVSIKSLLESYLILVFWKDIWGALVQFMGYSVRGIEHRTDSIPQTAYHIRDHTSCVRGIEYIC